MITKNNYITPQGHKRLLDELKNLLKIERPEVTKLIQWAASNGDRSENADYIYGKRRLREIDRRLRFLNKRLEAAVIVDPAKITSETVNFGATVVVIDEQGISKIFSIVGIDEINIAERRISWQSPIGKALLGKEVGDEVLVNTPSGEVVYEVVTITYKSIE